METNFKADAAPFAIYLPEMDRPYKTVDANKDTEMLEELHATFTTLRCYRVTYRDTHSSAWRDFMH